MSWPQVSTFFSANPVAAYAAILSTLSFLMALPLTVESYRKARRERGKLQVEHAEAGIVSQGGMRYENIIATLINVGTPTVSVTSYELRVYEGYFNILFRRNPVVYIGNGWRVPRGAESFTLSLADGMSPPLPVKAGEPIRLEIHTPPLWPDRMTRSVVFVIKFSHAPLPLRIRISPNSWNYTDEQGLADLQSRTIAAITLANQEGGWERSHAGIRQSRWWH
jgi:hypothetical protein